MKYFQKFEYVLPIPNGAEFKNTEKKKELKFKSKRMGGGDVLLESYCCPSTYFFRLIKKTFLGSFNSR